MEYEYEKGYYDEGYKDGVSHGYAEGWDAAMEHVKAEAERERKEKRAMCGRILNGE